MPTLLVTGGCVGAVPILRDYFATGLAAMYFDFSDEAGYGVKRYLKPITESAFYIWNRLMITMREVLTLAENERCRRYLRSDANSSYGNAYEKPPMAGTQSGNIIGKEFHYVNVWSGKSRFLN